MKLAREKHYLFDTQNYSGLFLVHGVGLHIVNTESHAVRSKQFLALQLLQRNDYYTFFDSAQSIFFSLFILKFGFF